MSDKQSTQFGRPKTAGKLCDAQFYNEPKKLSENARNYKRNEIRSDDRIYRNVGHFHLPPQILQHCK